MAYYTTADSVKYKGTKIDDRYIEAKLGNTAYKTKSFPTLVKARAYAYKKVNVIKGAKIPCEVGSSSEMNGWVYRKGNNTVWNDYSTGNVSILYVDGTLGKKVGYEPWWE